MEEAWDARGDWTKVPQEYQRDYVVTMTEIQAYTKEIAQIKRQLSIA